MDEKTAVTKKAYISNVCGHVTVRDLYTDKVIKICGTIQGAEKWAIKNGYQLV